MNLVQIVVALLIGYAFGNIPNGYLYAKAYHVDIFSKGSGNPGSTNILRNLGTRAGFTVLLMDVGKAVLAALLAHLLFRPILLDESTLLTLAAGTGAVLGHDFPAFPGLKGGKGVACSLGLVICFDFRLAIVLFLFFCLIVLITRYVSLGSILTMILAFLLIAALIPLRLLPASMSIYPYVLADVGFLMILLIWKHRSNIKRLLSGSENKFSFTRKGSLG